MSYTLILCGGERGERDKQTCKELGGSHGDDEGLCESSRLVSILFAVGDLRTIHLVVLDDVFPLRLLGLIYGILPSLAARCLIPLWPSLSMN